MISSNFLKVNNNHKNPKFKISSNLYFMITITKLLFIFLCNINANNYVLATVMPSFDRQTENVTVIIGNSVLLPCFISNLGDHKVAWIKVANMDILAIGDYKVTNDDRIMLSHGYVSDWSLSIQPVIEEDAGEYICQVNTEPQIITKINLKVLLPPKIIEEKSTVSPSPIKEGQTLSLYCHTEGMPTPKVTWYFRKRLSSPGSETNSNSHHHRNHHIDKVHSILHGKNSIGSEHVLHEGSTLTVRNMSRSHAGIYECIANNSVPPAASRKIRISVEFPPEITVPTNRIEQLIGLDARFECKIRASPLQNHYWMKDGQVIENAKNLESVQTIASNNKFAHLLNSSSKYEINSYNQNSVEHLTVSALIIKNLTTKDFGFYQCYAVNAYNTAKAEVELKELIVRRPTPTKIAASRILIYNNNKESGYGKQYQDESSYDTEFKLSKQYSSLSKQRKTINNSSSKLYNKLSLSESKISKSSDDESSDEEIKNSYDLLNAGNIIISKNLLILIILSFFCIFKVY